MTASLGRSAKFKPAGLLEPMGTPEEGASGFPNCYVRLRERDEPDVDPRSPAFAGALRAGGARAGRRTLRWLLLRENLLLSAAGAALGLAVTFGMKSILVSYASRFTPRAMG